jgi:hypothetical protein
MKKLFFILFCSFHCSLFSQINEELKKYYFNINKGENYLVEENFSMADSLYTNAILKNNKSFNVDLLNYLKFGKNENTLYFSIDLLLKRGYPLSELYTIPNIEKNLLSERGTKLIADSKKNTHSNKLRHSIDSLYRLDQFYRLKDDGYTKYRRNIIYTDSLSGRWLFNYFTKYGFPDENELGISEQFFNNEPLVTLIIHQSIGSKGRSVDLKKFVFDAILNGKINNKIGTFLYSKLAGKDQYGAGINLTKVFYSPESENDFSKRNVSESLHNKSQNGNFYVQKTTEEILNEINFSRSEVGLDSISNHLKKEYYQVNRNDTFAFAPFAAEVLHFSNKSDFEAFIQDLVEYE